VVLFADEDSAKYWSIDKVLTRWHSLFAGTLLTQQYLKAEQQ